MKYYENFYDQYDGIERNHLSLYNPIESNATEVDKEKNRVICMVELLFDNKTGLITEGVIKKNLKAVKAYLNSTRQRAAVQKLLDYIGNKNNYCVSFMVEDIVETITKLHKLVNKTQFHSLYISSSNVKIVKQAFKKNEFIRKSFKNGFIVNPYLRGNFAAIITDTSPFICIEKEKESAILIKKNAKDYIFATESYEFVILNNTAIYPICL